MNPKAVSPAYSSVSMSTALPFLFVCTPKQYHLDEDLQKLSVGVSDLESQPLPDGSLEPQEASTRLSRPLPACPSLVDMITHCLYVAVPIHHPCHLLGSWALWSDLLTRSGCFCSFHYIHCFQPVGQPCSSVRSGQESSTGGHRSSRLSQSSSNTLLVPFFGRFIYFYSYSISPADLVYACFPPSLSYRTASCKCMSVLGKPQAFIKHLSGKSCLACGLQMARYVFIYTGN